MGVESEVEVPFAALQQLCAPLLHHLEILPDPQRDAARTAFGLATGSSPDRLVIGLAVAQDKLTAEDAYQAACVDEIYQLEKWGADALAQKRLDGIKKELEAVEKFCTLVKS